MVQISPKQSVVLVHRTAIIALQLVKVSAMLGNVWLDMAGTSMTSACRALTTAWIVATVVQENVMLVLARMAMVWKGVHIASHAKWDNANAANKNLGLLSGAKSIGARSVMRAMASSLRQSVQHVGPVANIVIGTTLARVLNAPLALSWLVACAVLALTSVRVVILPVKVLATSPSAWMVGQRIGHGMPM